MTYKDAEFGFIGVVMELLGPIERESIMYELAKVYFNYESNADVPPVIEVCRVFWLQASHTYIEYVDDLVTVSESR